MNYLLYGNESYLLKQKLKEILTENDSGDAMLNTVAYEGSRSDFSIQRVLEDAWTIPFFADTKVVIVNNPLFLCAGNSLSDADAKDLDAYLKKPCDATVLVFYAEFENLDSRKKLTKAIQKNCRVIQCMHLDPPQFHAYGMKELKTAGMILDKEAQAELFQRIPNDMETFHHELEKLKLYGKQISKDEIIKLVSRPLDEDVFHLVNAVIQKDLKTALKLWQDLQILNKEPIYLVALLASQFRLMFQVKTLADTGRSEAAVAEELAVHPFRVKKAREAVSMLTKERLLEILAQLAALDQDFKSGTNDKKLSFELFLITMSR